MQKSNAPIKLTVAFASGTGAGPVNTIPLTTNPTTGGASYQTGFTSVNMEPIASGGVPPYGADVNGLFQNQTKAQIWQQAGYMYPFDATFAGNANIGGYPSGSVLMMGSGKGLWLNQSDNNTASPDATGSTGWLGLAAAGTSTITTTGGTTTPDPSVLGVTTLIVTGALTSNATLVLPLMAGVRWIVVNTTTGAFTLTVQGSSGTGVSVTSGSPIAVFTDGTNYYGVSANLSGAYLPISGTAVAATKLATARTIAMTGDVSWTSPAFDGTASVTAAGTIVAGAVSLAKMANFQTNSLMGNPTGSAAAPSAITLGSGLQFNSSQLQLAPSSSQMISWLGYTPVNKAGDTMTGNLNVSPTSGQATFALHVASAGNARVIQGFTGADARWQIQIGNSAAESGANAGSDFSLDAFSDTGGSLGSPLVINRATGAMTVEALTATSLTSNGNVTGSLYFISSSNSWVGATTGPGSIYLRPNGIGSVTGQVELDNSGLLTVNGAISTGAATVNGNLVVTGTINFGTSDAALKELGTPVEPRPFHRVPYYAYTRRDTGEHGWGPTAQDVASVAPEYTRTQRLSVNGDDRDVLLLAKEQITMDTAFWAGRQVDLLWQEVADLRQRLIDARAH